MSNKKRLKVKKYTTPHQDIINNQKIKNSKFGETEKVEKEKGEKKLYFQTYIKNIYDAT